MSYSNPLEIKFQSLADVKAFAKWYLGTTIPSSADDEFANLQDREDYFERRSSRLQIQLDNLRNINIEGACLTHYSNQTVFRLCKEIHDPLDTIGSTKKSSRFNYKENELFKTRALYLGQDKDCCYSEIFHSDFMTLCYPEFEYRIREDELVRPKYKLHEYRVNLKKLLVLTSSSTLKSIGISEGVLKDEWLELNRDFEIPSSSQIIGALARAKGFQGILYVSIRHQTKNNLVLFEENIGDIATVSEKISEKDFDLEHHERSIGLRLGPTQS